MCKLYGNHQAKYNRQTKYKEKEILAYYLRKSSNHKRREQEKKRTERNQKTIYKMSISTYLSTSIIKFKWTKFKYMD